MEVSCVPSRAPGPFLRRLGLCYRDCVTRLLVFGPNWDTYWVYFLHKEHMATKTTMHVWGGLAGNAMPHLQETLKSTGNPVALAILLRWWSLTLFILLSKHGQYGIPGCTVHGFQSESCKSCKKDLFVFSVKSDLCIRSFPVGLENRSWASGHFDVACALCCCNAFFSHFNKNVLFFIFYNFQTWLEIQKLKAIRSVLFDYFNLLMFCFQCGKTDYNHSINVHTNTFQQTSVFISLKT